MGRHLFIDGPAYIYFESLHCVGGFRGMFSGMPIGVHPWCLHAYRWCLHFHFLNDLHYIHCQASFICIKSKRYVCQLYNVYNVYVRSKLMFRHARKSDAPAPHFYPHSRCCNWIRRCWLLSVSIFGYRKQSNWNSHTYSAAARPELWTNDDCEHVTAA